MSGVWAFSFWNPIRDKSSEGNAALAAGKIEQALEAYGSALKEDPQNPQLLYNIANAYHRQGDLEKAKKYYNEALDRADDRLKAKIHANLGNNAFKAGEYSDSVESYVKSLRLSPKDEDVKANLELARKKLREDSQKEKNHQNQRSKEKKSNATRDNQAGERRPTKGGDPFDQSHPERNPGKNGESPQEPNADSLQKNPRSQENPPNSGNPGGATNGEQNQNGARQTTATKLSAQEAANLLQAIEDKQREAKKRFKPDQSTPSGADMRKDW